MSRKTPAVRDSLHGRVLVMDDEECIRDLVTLVLETRGAKVDTAVNGFEAVDLFKNAVIADSRYDLVILDLSVPDGLGGVETMTRLRDIDPDVNAILSSGFHYDQAVIHYRHYGFKGVLLKPYECAELLKIVGRLLVKSPAGSG